MKNERKPDDPRSKKGKRRHPVAGVPKILDQRKFAVWIGPDKVAIHLQILPGRLQVFFGEVFVWLAQKGHYRDATGGPVILRERSSNEKNLFLGLRGVPTDDALSFIEIMG